MDALTKRWQEEFIDRRRLEVAVQGGENGSEKTRTQFGEE